MSPNLFLDDVRNPEDVTWVPGIDYSNLNWQVVRTYDEFVKHITKHGIPETVSFDHDLADEHYPWNNPDGNPRYGRYKELTGYDAAKWLCDYCTNLKADLPICIVHSHNVIGKENIEKYIVNYLKYMAK